MRRSDIVYKQLAEDITDGNFVPGLRLPSEKALADTHGVSRPTVREALARLREDGLIISKQGAGAFVQSISERITRIEPLASIADIRCCFDYRIGLESECAYHAAKNRNESHLKKLEVAYTAMDKMNESQNTGVDEDFSFHLAVAHASRNRFFVVGLENLRAHIAQGISINRTLSLKSSGNRILRVQEEHRALIEAIRSGNSKASSDAMRRHLTNARARMFEGQST